MATNTLTASEIRFEQFCSAHSIAFERVPEAEIRTPDYRVLYDGQPIYFEIKQIDSDEDFSPEGGSRVVGDHIRTKIKSARGQMRTVADEGHRAILLVMNNLDGLQLFGTEQTDFVAAMYGQWEVELDEVHRVADSYHGENRAFRPRTNQNFSGLGFILQTRTIPEITVYENIHARWPIETLPRGFEIMRFETSKARL